MLSKYGKILWILSLLILAVVLSNTVIIAAEKIEISWFSDNHQEPQIIPLRSKLIQEFEELHPNVTIKQIQAVDTAEWMQFSTMARAGKTPDIADIGIENIGTAIANGWVLSLDKYVTEKDKEVMSENALKGGTVDGKLYGWPFWGGIYAQYYNKRLLIEAGLDPNNLPETWDEFLGWMKKLNNPPAVYGLVDVWNSSTCFRHHMPWVWSNGGKLLNDDNTKCLLDQPAAVEALRFRTELFTKYNLVPPGPTTYAYTEETRAFSYEKAASMTNALWALPKVLEDNPEAMENNIVIGTMPYNKEKVTFAYTVFMVIGANSKHPELAAEFMKFLTTKEAETQRALQAKWIPFRKDIVTDPEIQKDEYLTKFIELMESGQLPPNIPQSAGIQVRVVEMVQDVLIGKATPEEASVEATKDINKMLTK